MVRKRIEKVVLVDNLITSKYDQEQAEEQVKVLRVRLGPNGRPGLQVSGLCGNPNCSFWIFDPSNGAILLDAEGYELKFSSTTHNGLHDIEMKLGFGAMEGGRDVYEFDGKRYQRVKSVVIKY